MKSVASHSLQLAQENIMVSQRNVRKHVGIIRGVLKAPNGIFRGIWGPSTWAPICLLIVLYTYIRGPLLILRVEL